MLRDRAALPQGWLLSRFGHAVAYRRLTAHQAYARGRHGRGGGVAPAVVRGGRLRRPRDSRAGPPGRAGGQVGAGGTPRARRARFPRLRSGSRPRARRSPRTLVLRGAGWRALRPCRARVVRRPRCDAPPRGLPGGRAPCARGTPTPSPSPRNRPTARRSPVAAPRVAAPRAAPDTRDSDGCRPAPDRLH